LSRVQAAFERRHQYMPRLGIGSGKLAVGAGPKEFPALLDGAPVESRERVSGIDARRQRRIGALVEIAPSQDAGRIRALQHHLEARHRGRREKTRSLPRPEWRQFGDNPAARANSLADRPPQLTVLQKDSGAEGRDRTADLTICQ
jgi:hypothetical protein